MHAGLIERELPLDDRIGVKFRIVIAGDLTRLLRDELRRRVGVRFFNIFITNLKGMKTRLTIYKCTMLVIYIIVSLTLEFYNCF